MEKNSRKHSVAADLTVLREQAAGWMVIGIDVGDRYSRICVMDQQGNRPSHGRAPLVNKPINGKPPGCIKLDHGVPL